MPVQQRDRRIPVSPRQMGVLEANDRGCEASEVEGSQELQVVALRIDLEKIDALDVDEEVFERDAVDGNGPDPVSCRVVVPVASLPVLEALAREGGEAGKGRDRIAGTVLDDEERSRSAFPVDGRIDEGESVQPVVVLHESMEVLRLGLDQDSLPAAVDDVLVEPVERDTVEGADLDEEELVSTISSCQVVREHVLEVEVESVAGPGGKGRHATELVATALELRLDEALHRGAACR